MTAVLALAVVLPLGVGGCGVLFREDAFIHTGTPVVLTAENLLPYCANAAVELTLAPTVAVVCCLGETGLDGLLRAASIVVGTPFGMETFGMMPG